GAAGEAGAGAAVLCAATAVVSGSAGRDEHGIQHTGGAAAERRAGSGGAREDDQHDRGEARESADALRGGGRRAGAGGREGVEDQATVEDLSGLGEEEQRARVTAALRREWEEPFNLKCGPLLRMGLLKLSELDHILLRTMHHIVSDGWSQGVFNREFAVLYE